MPSHFKTHINNLVTDLRKQLKGKGYQVGTYSWKNAAYVRKLNVDRKNNGFDFYRQKGRWAIDMMTDALGSIQHCYNNKELNLAIQNKIKALEAMPLRKKPKLDSNPTPIDFVSDKTKPVDHYIANRQKSISLSPFKVASAECVDIVVIKNGKIIIGGPEFLKPDANVWFRVDCIGPSRNKFSVLYNKTSKYFPLRWKRIDLDKKLDLTKIDQKVINRAVELWLSNIA